MTTHQPLIELEAGPVTAGGGCVARTADGSRVVFVRHCLPGRARDGLNYPESIVYLRADAVEILVASPDRVRGIPTRIPGLCGGCDWQHARLPSTACAQGGSCHRTVATSCRNSPHEVEVEEIPGAPDGLSWRTQVRFSVDEVGRVGLRKYRSHDVQVVERCIYTRQFHVEAAGVETKRWPGVQEIEVFSPDESECLVSVTTRAKKSKPLPSWKLALRSTGVRPVLPRSRS